MITLKGRRKIFADHYLQFGDSTAAAIDAGYCLKAPESSGCRLVKNGKVKLYIRQEKEKKEEKARLDAEKRYQASQKIVKEEQGNPRYNVDALDDSGCPPAYVTGRTYRR